MFKSSNSLNLAGQHFLRPMFDFANGLLPVFCFSHGF